MRRIGFLLLGIVGIGLIFSATKPSYNFEEPECVIGSDNVTLNFRQSGKIVTSLRYNNDRSAQAWSRGYGQWPRTELQRIYKDWRPFEGDTSGSAKVIARVGGDKSEFNVYDVLMTRTCYDAIWAAAR